MKKVRIVLPSNEKQIKEQNYGYMQPLKTRDKTLYSLHSKDWNKSIKKKKKNISMATCLYSCVRNLSKWNNLSDPKTKLTMMGPGATEKSAKSLQQLYFANFLWGKNP